jgi:hypothetical protein
MMAMGESRELLLILYDPFVIYCVIQSDYPNKDLTTRDGVIDTVNYEL